MASLMATTDVVSFGALRERTYPLFCGVVAAVVVFAVSPHFFTYAADMKWNLGSLYLAGFDFAAVATSFLFTFYTFVVTAERGFIIRMKKSIYYSLLITYTVRALTLGVILALVSLPLMVIGPAPESRWDNATILIAIWAFIAVWTVAAFIRTTRLFIAFATADV
jgi:hypothetical protein